MKKLNRSLVRVIAVVVSFSLLGAFLVVSTVHLMLPQDPINPGPTLNYTTLLVISFVIFLVLLGIGSKARLIEEYQS